MQVIFWDFDRTDFRSVGIARRRYRYVYHTLHLCQCLENRLIKDKIRIKIIKLLATTSKKSNILEKNDDFLELLRVIIYTGDEIKKIV